MIRSVTLISIVLTMLKTAIVTPIPLIMVRNRFEVGAEILEPARPSRWRLRTSIGSSGRFRRFDCASRGRRRTGLRRTALARRGGREQRTKVDSNQAGEQVEEQIAGVERLAARRGLPRLDFPPFEDVLNPVGQDAIAHVAGLLDVEGGDRVLAEPVDLAGLR